MEIFYSPPRIALFVVIGFVLMLLKTMGVKTSR